MRSMRSSRVKEVRIEKRRYVICYNPDEAHKDRHDREAIVRSYARSSPRAE
jgi:hypothetical protein